MIVFNELEVTPDGKTLIIDISCKSTEYYITGIKIDTQDTYLDGGPSEKAYSISVENLRHVKYYLLKEELKSDPNSTMYFIYVSTSNENITLGITFKAYDIYYKLLQEAKLNMDTLSISDDFIDTFLTFEALKAAINTNHFIEAINIFKKYFKNPNVVCLNCNNNV